MKPTPTTAPAGSTSAVNQHFYDALWGQARLIEPERFNTWPVVNELVETRSRKIEIAAGLRPRLPVTGTCFVDISPPALRALAPRAKQVLQASITQLPIAHSRFDLVCALDVVEHVENGDDAMAELARIAADGATLLLSIPLYMKNWTPFDDMVGHFRRYEPQALVEKLEHAGFVIERSAAYGMQPRKSWLVDVGMWYLAHQPQRAMWWYNRVFMPMGLRSQKPLHLQPGFVVDKGVDEIFLVCRRNPRSASGPSSQSLGVDAA